MNIKPIVDTVKNTANSIGQWVSLYGLLYAMSAAWDIAPEGVMKNGIGAAIALFLSGTVGTEISRLSRYRVKAWSGVGFIQETDSGRPPFYGIFLRRSRPNFLLFPLSHLFVKWPVYVGRISQETGSVDITDKSIAGQKKSDHLKFNIGTNVHINKAAANHILSLHGRLSEKPNLSQKEQDQLDTINGLLASGLQVDGLSSQAQEV